MISVSGKNWDETIINKRLVDKISYEEDFVIDGVDRWNNLLTNKITPPSNVFVGNKIIFDDNLIFFLIFSSLGIVLIFNYFLISKKNKLLFFCLLIFCFPKYILQEYFEPLILIALFTLFDLGKNNYKIFQKDKTVFMFCTFFSIYYLGSFFYRYYLNPIN